VWHAHNVFLDVALELGLVGLAVFVAGFAILAAQLAQAALGQGPRRMAAIAGCCILVGFTLKNFPDDFVVRHIALFCAALAGMLSAAMRWPSR
jgi:O-antigen ligase